MIEVSIRELKSRLSYYLRKVEDGERVTITRRGKPVGAMLASAPKGDRLYEKMLELQAKGVLVQVSDRKPSFPKKGVRMRGEGPTIAEMVLEDRR